MTKRQEMPGEQSGQNSIERLQETALNITYNFASMVTMPVEIFVRPWYGSRYFSPPVFLLSTCMMLTASAFTSLAGTVGQMIPFVHVPRPVGLFDIASMTKLFFLASVVHGLRIWRRMIHMELEENSMFEGPPLPFFRLLPLGSSFWGCRIVLEPAAVFALSIVLGNLFIIQRSLMIYLQITAMMMAAKQVVAWYKMWAITRNLLDRANAGPIIARFVENKATEDDMARVHLASLPKNLPSDVRNAAVAHLARAYSMPEPEAPKRNPESGSSGLKFIFLALVVATFLCFIIGGVTLRRTVARIAHRASVQEQRLAAPSVFHESEQDRAKAARESAFRSLSYLGGIWAGSGAARESGMCTIRLEIRPHPESQFAGYATLTCIPLVPFRVGNALAVLLQRTPRSSIMTGIPSANGSIGFRVDKNIGADPRCPMMALTAVPFGAAQLAIDWRNGSCPGGQMVLTRAGQ